ncbi:MAG TPA: redoxin family protein [Chthoniobacteraceae bacterium]|nr:redoxin family protein [Chthoniobacteraceae bacterium]
MKNLLPFATALAVALLIPFHTRADDTQPAPTPSTQIVSDLSQFKTADALHTYIVGIDARPAKTDGEFDANWAATRAATADFLKRFPADPSAWEVKLIDARVVVDATGRGRQGYDLAKAQAELQEVAAAPAADPKIKYAANIALARIQMRDVADDKLEPWLVAWKNAHHDGWQDETLGMLLTDRLAKWDEATKEKNLLVLKNSQDEDIYGNGEDLLWATYRAKRDASFKVKPIDLKFTAVDGTAVDVSKLRGKVVLIDFWATWCIPCMAEQPEIIAAYNKYHAKGFEVIGISLERGPKDKLLAVTKAKGMPWPQYYDGKEFNNDISYAYGISGIPVLWLVNKKGMVVDMNPTGNLDAAVAKLLAEPE